MIKSRSECVCMSVCMYFICFKKEEEETLHSFNTKLRWFKNDKICKKTDCTMPEEMVINGN